MARVILEQPGEDVFVGGAFNGFGDDTDTTVIGTAAGGEVIDVEQGDIVLDASFNQGGDTIRLEGEASQYTARREGSRIILESVVNQTRISIPIGEPITIIFGGDDTRTLQIVNGQVVIGDEVIDGTPTFLDSLDQAALTQALFNLEQAEADLQDFLRDNNVSSAAEADARADACEAELRAARADQTDSQLVAEVNEQQADVEAARLDVARAEAAIDADLAALIAAEDAAEARVAEEVQDVREAQAALTAAQRAEDRAEAARIEAQQDQADAQATFNNRQSNLDLETTQLRDAEQRVTDAQAAVTREQGDIAPAEERVRHTNEAVQREGDDVAVAFRNFEASTADPDDELVLQIDNPASPNNENNTVRLDPDGDPATNNSTAFIVRDGDGVLRLAFGVAATPEALAVLQQVRELDAAENERQLAETNLINQQEDLRVAQQELAAATAAEVIAQREFDDALAARNLARTQLDAANDTLADATAAERQAEINEQVAQNNLERQQLELDQANRDLVAARAATDAEDPGRVRREGLDDARADLAREEAELRAAIEALEERRDMIEECREERAIANEAARLEGIRDDRADDVGDLGFTSEIVDGDNGVGPPPPQGTQEDEEATAGNDAFVFVNDEDVNEFFVINNFGDQGDDVLFIGGQEFTLVRIGGGVEVGDDDVGDDTRMEIFVQQQGDDVVLFIEDDPFDGNANPGGFTGDIIVLTDNTAGDVNLSDGGFITVDDNIFGTAQNANFA